MYGSLGASDVVILLVLVGYVGLLGIPAWRLATRIGYPGWLGLGIFVPVVNLVLLWVAAFGDWPREQTASTG